LLVGVSSSPMEIVVSGKEWRGDEEFRGVVRSLLSNIKRGDDDIVWGMVGKAFENVSKSVSAMMVTRLPPLIAKRNCGKCRAFEI